VAPWQVAAQIEEAGLALSMDEAAAGRARRPGFAIDRLTGTPWWVLGPADPPPETGETP